MVLVGCATQYGPRGITGGYAEQQIAEGTYQVEFTGNGFTSPAAARAGAMRRAAEIAVLTRRPFFIVANSAEDLNTYHLGYTPIDCTSTGYGQRVSTTCTGGHEQTATKPTAMIVVRMFTAEEAAALPAHVVLTDANLILGRGPTPKAPPPEVTPPQTAAR